MLTELLGIKHPLIQAPMLGVTTPDMVAAVSNLGALGSLPIGGLAPEEASTLIRATTMKTTKPFAVNLFAHDVPSEVDDRVLDTTQKLLQQFCKDYNIPFTARQPEDFTFYSAEDQLELLIEEAIPVVSFTFGILPDAMMRELKQRGVILIGTATSLEEGFALRDAGVDVICAQGIEAGGHRGSFQEGTLPQVNTLALVASLHHALQLPIIGAGGISNATTTRETFAAGAEAVQIGSLFLTAQESAAAPGYKKAVLSCNEDATIITRAFTGRWSRAIRNRFAEWAQLRLQVFPDYTLMNALTKPVRTYASEHDLTDFIALYAGLRAGEAQEGTTAEITERILSWLPS